MQNAPREHSAILSTCIKLPSIFKAFLLPILSTFLLSILEWPLKTGLTVFKFKMFKVYLRVLTCSMMLAQNVFKNILTHAPGLACKGKYIGITVNSGETDASFNFFLASGNFFSPADNLNIQFDPYQDRSRSESKPFDTLIVYLNEFFEKS